MQRFGQIIGVKPDQIEAYERVHAEVWPEVLAMISECNIYNFSIFRHENLLFAYFEYSGQDFAADMAKMAAHPKTQEWWTVTSPMQQPFEGRAPGEWAIIKEVFHTE